MAILPGRPHGTEHERELDMAWKTYNDGAIRHTPTYRLLGVIVTILKYILKRVL